MPSVQALVREFHEAFGGVVRDVPTDPPRFERYLRANLIDEESTEAIEALQQGGSIEEIVKELADIVYVTYGTALHLGVDLDAVLAEVHRSNMAKVANGYARRRRDGKVLKPAGWTPPDIKGALGL